MTTQQEARMMAADLMHRHRLTGWSFGFDNARRRSGCCHWSEKRITLSRHFVALNGPDRIEKTLLHEVAHALAGSGTGHGPKWVRICRSIGGDGQRCYSSAETTMPTSKYVGRCGCGQEFARFKFTDAMRRGALACRTCSNRIVWTLRSGARA